MSAAAGQPATDRVGRMSLSLPDTTVRPAHGSLAYYVRTKSFATAMHDHHGNGRTELWVKGTRDAQQEWVASDDRLYYVPPYVGPSGWIGIWLDVDVVDWPSVAELLVDGYLIQAGTRAATTLDPIALVATALAVH